MIGIHLQEREEAGREANDSSSEPAPAQQIVTLRQMAKETLGPAGGVLASGVRSARHCCCVPHEQQHCVYGLARLDDALTHWR